MLPEGYHAVVIGAGGAIGAGTAQLLASRGARVTVVDRDEAAVGALAEELVGAGVQASARTTDVENLVGLRTLADEAQAITGRIDALVNTAGVQGPLGEPSHLVDIADFERTLSINLTAAMRLAQAFVPHMLDRGYGRIVHVTSIAGKEGNPSMAAYSASKAGLIGVVKTQGKEYAGTGVCVNAVAPAVIRTPFLDEQPEAVLEYMTSRIPMGRAGEVAEVAETIAFAASPACSFTTGFTFDVSGGRATY